MSQELQKKLTLCKITYLKLSKTEALEKELEIGQPIFSTEDMMEGRTAFAEKRKPKFKGK